MAADTMPFVYMPHGSYNGTQTIQSQRHSWSRYRDIDSRCGSDHEMSRHNQGAVPKSALHKIINISGRQTLPGWQVKQPMGKLVNASRLQRSMQIISAVRTSPESIAEQARSVVPAGLPQRPQHAERRPAAATGLLALPPTCWSWLSLQGPPVLLPHAGGGIYSASGATPP